MNVYSIVFSYGQPPVKVSPNGWLGKTFGDGPWNPPSHIASSVELSSESAYQYSDSSLWGKIQSKSSKRFRKNLRILLLDEWMADEGQCVVCSKILLKMVRDFLTIVMSRSWKERGEESKRTSRFPSPIIFFRYTGSLSSRALLFVPKALVASLVDPVRISDLWV